MTTFPLLDPTSDLHVHSTWSDGESTIEENLASAAGHGLRTLGLVDHVRRDTTWVPGFAEAVRALDGIGGVQVLLGVEAKVLDTQGAVDLPAELPPLDYVLLADHQLPRPEGPMHPRDASAALADGSLHPDQVIEDLVEATVAGFACYDRVIVAHLFSILPKCGLGEHQVPDRLVQHLGSHARKAGVVFEVNEKWTCPTGRVAGLLARQGVGITLSTDAHHEARVGRYRYVAEVAAELEAEGVGAGAAGSAGAAGAAGSAGAAGAAGSAGAAGAAGSAGEP